MTKKDSRFDLFFKDNQSLDKALADIAGGNGGEMLMQVLMDARERYFTLTAGQTDMNLVNRYIGAAYALSELVSKMEDALRKEEGKASFFSGANSSSGGK